jgi:hypothetical protein
MLRSGFVLDLFTKKYYFNTTIPNMTRTKPEQNRRDYKLRITR